MPDPIGKHRDMRMAATDQQQMLWFAM
ncbi:hypothetical protein NAP1_09482 [Erythrobacter sp. NAP1]|nr:hypothetical protein NAP1_09482 [Erythrobacter sp. NAP1]